MLLLDWSLIWVNTNISHQFFATLHWLPVHQRIIFKIAVLSFHCVHGTCPVYFKDVCMPLAAIPGRTNLWAANWGDLLVPSTKTKIGGQSFRVAAPTVWYSLPLHLHNATISERQFKSALKTHLFNLAYKWHLSSDNYWRVNLLTYLITNQWINEDWPINLLFNFPHHILHWPIVLIQCNGWCPV